MSSTLSGFGRQSSNCDPDFSDVTPTAEEVDLSQIIRPGMRGSREIKQVVNAGTYAFDATTRRFTPNANCCPLVLAERAAEVERPHLHSMAEAIWTEPSSKEWIVTIHGCLSSIIEVPVQFATDGTLGYYGCRILGAGDKVHISRRSIITNFIYGSNYLDDYVIKSNGGSGVEHHGFAHLDTPLDDNSGHLVLGKIDKETDALELTAFKVPKGVSVYIPEDTIHTNDYFLGTWETLLSPACKFPSAKLKRLDRSSLKILPVEVTS